jgi:restriction system protein
MPRAREDDSLIIDIAKDFEHLPWWGGTVFAVFLVASAIGIHYLQVQWILWPVMQAFLMAFLGLTALMVVAFTVRGLVRYSFDRRRFDRTDNLRELDPYQFERHIGEYYRRRGYLVTAPGLPGRDGGVDVVLEARGERIIVQCKHWKAWQVGVRPLRELWGLLYHRDATGAIVVTSGVFTREALAFAQGKSLQLIDGAQLARMVSEVKSVPHPATTAGPRLAPADSPAATETLPAIEGSAPALRRLCPSCGAEMVLRTARRGDRVGEQFWGCSTFPMCRKTLPVQA